MFFTVAALFFAPILWIPIIFYMGFSARKELIPFRHSGSPKYYKFFFCFAVSAIISGILSFNPVVMLFSLCIPAFYVFIVYLYFYCSSIERIEKIIYVAFICAAISGLIGIICELFDVSKTISPLKFIFGMCDMLENEKNNTRLLATFYNANVAATFFGSFTFVGAYYLLNTDKKNTKKMLFFGVCELIIVIALWCTGSRGALLGVAIGFMFYFGMNNRKLSAVVALVVFVIWLLLILFFPTILSRGGEILFSDMGLRFDIWLDGLRQFSIKPLFGWGLAGAYLYTGDEYNFIHVLHAHNFLITALAYYGIIGFFFCCALEISKLVVVWQLYKARNKMAPLFFAISGMFWGQGIFDCTFASPQGALLYFGASTILLALVKSNLNKTETTV